MASVDENISKALNALKQQGIAEPVVTRHAAVMTAEAHAQLALPQGVAVKNLLFRGKKDKKLFLFVVHHSRLLNMKELAKTLVILKTC